MNADIFFKEWKRYRMSLLLWTGILSLLIVMTMIFYPTVVENAAQLESFMESPMIGSMMEIFGGGGDVTAFLDILGFYATKNISFVLLLGSIFSVILASTIVAREENEKTADFLLTRPVTRTEVFITKTAVWFSILVVLNLIITGVGYTTLEAFKSDAPQKVIISEETKEHLVIGLRNNPSKIHSVFRPDDKMFDEWMIRQLHAEAQNRQVEIEEAGISQEAMDKLMSEFAGGPEYLMQQIRDNPDEYISMLGIPAEQREEFLQQLETSERNYRDQKNGFQHDPQVFIQFFEQDPVFFMHKYKNDVEGLEKAIHQFGWDDATAKAAFYAYHVRDFFILSFYCFLLMLVFGSMGLLASVLIRRGRPISNVAIGFVLAAYVIDAASKISEKLAYIGYLSPFKFVNINVLEAGYGLELWRVAYLVLVPLALVLMAQTIYKNKDIII